MELYNIVGMVPHADFQRIIDPENQVSQLLLSHFLAAHVLLREVTIHENLKEDAVPMYKVFQGWMMQIQATLSPSFKKFNEWPFTYVMNFDVQKAEEMVADYARQVAKIELNN
jgi:hypothetical protein